MNLRSILKLLFSSAEWRVYVYKLIYQHFIKGRLLKIIGMLVGVITIIALALGLIGAGLWMLVKVIMWVFNR